MWGRYRRWPRIRPLVYAAVAIALGGWVWLRGSSGQRVELGVFSAPAAVARAGPCEVLAVVDGDTLLIRQEPARTGGREFIGNVRLLGIKSSEIIPDLATRPGAAEAMQFLGEKVSAGNVRLQLDKRRIDRRGRCLAYVYVGNVHLSEALVAAGLARVHTYPGDSMTINRQLLRAQDEARRRQAGIWSDPSSFTRKNADAESDD